MIQTQLTDLRKVIFMQASWTAEHLLFLCTTLQPANSRILSEGSLVETVFVYEDFLQELMIIAFGKK